MLADIAGAQRREAPARRMNEVERDEGEGVAEEDDLADRLLRRGQLTRAAMRPKTRTLSSMERMPRSASRRSEVAVVSLTRDVPHRKEIARRDLAVMYRPTPMLSSGAVTAEVPGGRSSIKCRLRGIIEALQAASYGEYWLRNVERPAHCRFRRSGCRPRRRRADLTCCSRSSFRCGRPFAPSTKTSRPSSSCHRSPPRSTSKAPRCRPTRSDSFSSCCCCASPARG